MKLEFPLTESHLIRGLNDVSVKENVNNPELQKHDLNKLQKIGSECITNRNI